jgi:hypothetical protein
MKRLIAALSIFTVLVLNVPALAATWDVKFSTPAPLTNKKSFNLDFTALSSANDNISVTAYRQVAGPDQNLGIKNVSGGNSGSFKVTVTSDGTYRYYLIATNNGDVKQSSVKTVTVDTTAPSAPTYLGKTRDGNKYTVRFRAPNDSDVTQIRIYSSTKTSFTVSTDSQVGTVNVTPGQIAQITYTASSGAERFHAVQAFDKAGNNSSLIGDPDTTVTQEDVATDSQADGAVGERDGISTTGAANSDQTGDVGGEATGGEGQVSDEAASTTEDEESGEEGVLGTDTDENGETGTVALSIFLLIIAVLIGAYYWFLYRNEKSLTELINQRFRKDK